ncbi:hypothetical protein H6501_00155 [Candidatus Woesearchaeota archaeon]|nr:hypothetical protein [Nanoarchaeota archaeon]MCB9369994.1 hypothetical protein [Candidatus Woesearchaeota archaeon]USN44529.1 MAG: hypothetical protein H6500_01625 [Candidatus Woesearchaeota archaeon]
MKKGLVSISEIVFLLFLFSSVMIFVNREVMSKNTFESDHLEVESLLLSLYYSDEFRQLVVEEDLSQASVSGNWLSLETLLASQLGNYEILVGNLSTQKVLVACDAQNFKVQAQVPVVAFNETSSEFRYLQLGVCS